MIRLRPIAAPPARDEALLARSPAEERLENIKSHLDLLLLALEAIAGLSSEAMLDAARELGVEAIADRVGLWRLRQSNPLRKSSGGRKKLDVEEARSLVLVICHLARQQRDILRQAIAVLEQVAMQDRPPHRHPLLGDYLDAFANFYQERMQDDTAPKDALEDLALKLLVDLLFYSAPHGRRRLWTALID
ncbi:protein of unknown function (DUF3038) [Rubidibacter lacunae KORDI 51-2]|uniref:DUF3038 domain-containing protein n=1 Tax=Rubidibacter lacunae KORDI 51-2 TaxID=582515 RepID=U5DM46_9CHRO|nr:DUF3038 domain-containing protein [Rubidibacter lacunae]ERN41649.1 protein of unknown function (DUF3038) [Rubidibacter lacunae KORDI 51-2]